jgi:hypothetical protein
MLIDIYRSAPSTPRGYISGQSRVLGAPSGGHVLDLFTREPRVWIRSTLSSPLNGSFAFPALELGVEYNVEGRHATREYEDRIVGAVEASTRPIMRAETWVVPIGLPFAARARVDYGEAPLAYTLTGTLPSGLTEADGIISGAWPTGTPGDYPLTVSVEDAVEQAASATVLLRLVLLPLEIVTPMPAFVVGVPASVTLVARGGEGPYTYAVTSGSRPAGLSLNGSTGVIAGTPTTPGAYSFDITVTDVRSTTASKTYSGKVSAFGSHKYWRVYVTAAAGGYGSMTELEFLDDLGARCDLAGGTPIKSSELSGHEAYRAFDGVVSGDSPWASSNGTPPMWLGYKHAAAVVVDSVRITARSTNVTQSPNNFTVQSSDDGVSWTDEWSVTGSTGWGANEQRTFPRP